MTMNPSNMSDHDLLISMNTKLDTMLATVADHETRMRRLERWFWVSTGMAAAAGASGSAIAQSFMATH